MSAGAYVHRISDLRLGEFDLGGVLYHANYYHLYEAAREACLAAHGAPYHSLVSAGYHLAIVEAGQRFLSPICYGDPLEVLLSFSELSRTSVRASYEITAHGRIVHNGWTRLVHVENSGGKFRPGRFPQKLVEIFNAHGDGSASVLA